MKRKSGLQQFAWRPPPYPLRFNAAQTPEGRSTGSLAWAGLANTFFWINSTASDRYAGWIGQIYSEGRYDKGISRRSHKVGDKTFNEETLPVESVAEYFERFPQRETMSVTLIYDGKEKKHVI